MPGNDIVASDIGNWNAGAGFEPIGSASTPFTGTFDGLGHMISGLTINQPTTDNVSLFGATQSATVATAAELEAAEMAAMVEPEAAAMAICAMRILLSGYHLPIWLPWLPRNPAERQTSDWIFANATAARS
ncbi:hypothetical protein ACE0DR_09320 [Azotobacter sp. CWF10]